MQTEIKALRLLFEPGSAGKGEHAAFEELNRFIAEATGSAPETAAPNAKTRRLIGVFNKDLYQ